MTNREIALFPAFLDQLFIVCYISYCVVTNSNIIKRLGFVLAYVVVTKLICGVHIVFEWLLINCCVVITGQPTTRSNESIVVTRWHWSNCMVTKKQGQNNCMNIQWFDIYACNLANALQCFLTLYMLISYYTQGRVCVLDQSESSVGI